MTNNEIIGIVKSELGIAAMDKAAVYLMNEQLAAGDTANVPALMITAEKASHLVFADLEPGANWSHSCVYLLIDVSDGHVETVKGKLPPAINNYTLLMKGKNVEDWMVIR